MCLLPTLTLKDLTCSRIKGQKNAVLQAQRGRFTESWQTLTEKLLNMMTLSYQCVCVNKVIFMGTKKSTVAKSQPSNVQGDKCVSTSLCLCISSALSSTGPFYLPLQSSPPFKKTVRNSLLVCSLITVCHFTHFIEILLQHHIYH